MFKRKIKVSFINTNWELITEQKVDAVPRPTELIYIEDNHIYYEVINVIHFIKDKNSIVVVIKELSNQSKPLND